MTPFELSSDRRRYPRIRKRLPMEVRQDGGFEIAETIDLSCNGAYCRLHRPLPEMTRVEVMLSLPPADGGSNPVQASCLGVVVRSETDRPGDHRIAVFFDDISDAEREKIARFIARRDIAETA